MNEPTIEQDCTALDSTYTNSDIRCEFGDKIRNWGGWYRHITVYLGETKLSGGIQEKRRNKRNELMTYSGNGNYCVQGSSIVWLLRDNGYTVKESEYGFTATK